MSRLMIVFALTIAIATAHNFRVVTIVKPVFYKTTSDTVLRLDSIVVEKAARRMTVYYNGDQLKFYDIALGRSPDGDKQFQGDMKTPEGLYIINDKNPNSGFHKNLGVSYPNSNDRREARKLGKPPGGDIKIHGLPNGQGGIGRMHLSMDWTYGCIAVTNEEMDELYAATAVGTPILILP